jgi:hypothetical protein
MTEEGCNLTARSSDPALAVEQFTYASRAVAGLCEVEPGHWLCDTTCDGCEPPPPPPPAAEYEDSCGFSPRRAGRSQATGGVLLALALAAVGSRRRTRT